LTRHLILSAQKQRVLALHTRNKKMHGHFYGS
jgi:hypothetical protein